jgi:hypothetical protein
MGAEDMTQTSNGRAHRPPGIKIARSGQPQALHEYTVPDGLLAMNVEMCHVR